MFDMRHPFFLPLWRRILTVGICLGWALMELLTGSPGWALLFGAVGGWAGWQLLVTWDPTYFDKTTDETDTDE